MAAIDHLPAAETFIDSNSFLCGQPSETHKSRSERRHRVVPFERRSGWGTLPAESQRHHVATLTPQADDEAWAESKSGAESAAAGGVSLGTGHLLACQPAAFAERIDNRQNQ